MIKVIGAGLGRTGTHSLATALEQLGFGPCYHMFAFGQHPEHLPVWKAALYGQTVDWAKLLEGFQASVEWPGVAFLPQLLDAFPAAKVILTVRDPRSWVESINNTVFDGLQLSQFNPDPLQRERSAFTREMILERTFSGRFRDAEHVMRVFDGHNQLVRQLVPAANLLEFQIGAGWGPLCGFLGVPVPNIPFPRTNHRDAFLETEPDWAKAARKRLGL
jgi:hypothetical protein